MLVVSGHNLSPKGEKFIENQLLSGVHNDTASVPGLEFDDLVAHPLLCGDGQLCPRQEWILNEVVSQLAVFTVGNIFVGKSS